MVLKTITLINKISAISLHSFFAAKSKNLHAFWRLFVSPVAVMVAQEISKSTKALTRECLRSPCSWRG